MNESHAAQLLQEKFGSGKQTILARAPGRVNLIGEHTDYNEGFVLPFAIDRFTEVAVRPRKDFKIRVYSAAFDDVLHAELPLRPSPQKTWRDYVLGVLWEFAKSFDLHHGFDAAIWSNIPVGAGLSSSAALEVAFSLALSQLYAVDLSGLDLVKLCQRAEKDFVGMPCGIMDQYVAYFARADTALFLDTRALEHEYVPLNLKNVALLVVDSGVKRGLTHSGYADRRRECHEAGHWLAQHFPCHGILTLRDVDEDLLQRVKGEMPHVLYKRALHVVTENRRVLATAEALKQEEWQEVGRLLYASHESLRDLFQVSIPEADFLVEWGMEHGAWGARIVGGGFGGITLHLVPREVSSAYSQGIRKAYTQRFGHITTVLEVRAADGANVL